MTSALEGRRQLPLLPAPAGTLARARAPGRFAWPAAPSRPGAPPRSSASRRRSALGALLCLLCLLGALGPEVASAAPALTWSVQSSLENDRLSAISCASGELCVIVDHSGNAFATRDPLAQSPSWGEALQIDEGHPLTSLSCVAPSTCAAVDGSGNIIVTSDPAADAPAGSSAGSGARGAGASWHSIAVAGAPSLDGVACASTSLCVAVGVTGETIAVDPQSVGSAPTSADVDSTTPLRAISCPTASLCVAVDAVGGALSSSDPGAPSPSWQRRTIDSGAALLDLSCLSSAASGFCVALDGEGNALASGDPGAPSPTWSSTMVDGAAPFSSVSCTGPGLCVAVDDAGSAFESDGVTLMPPTWTRSTAELSPTSIEGIACLPAGLCLAVDSSGRTLSALVPAPTVSTLPASGLSEDGATLVGDVDPNDSLLGECSFEYGTSVLYGQSVPCASLPPAASALEQVNASISGLEAGTSYHYRLSVADASGVSLGADEVLTTVAKPSVSVVRPRPYISGVPAVGLRLHCNPGLSSTSGVTLHYSWSRDGKKISGAGGATYQVRSQDAKHHLQCTVSASDSAGSASASSAFVAIPAEGILAAAGETLLGRVRAEGSRVSVPLTCSPHSAGSCEISLRLGLVETLRGARLIGVAARRKPRIPPPRQVGVTVSSTSVRLAPGQQSTVTLALDGTGRSLLRREHHLPVKLTVRGTVIGSIAASLGSEVLTLFGPGRAASAHTGAALR